MTNLGLGDKIEQLRKERGLTRLDFCEDESNLTVRQLVRIEKGESKPTLDKLDYIAHRLGIPSYVLMPDYKELPKRYLELKFHILRHPDYGNSEFLNRKRAYFDEIYEQFYETLPRHEQLLIETLQLIDNVRESHDAADGRDFVEEKITEIEKKKALTTNDFLYLRLYFLCNLMDRVVLNQPPQINREKSITLFQNMGQQLQNVDVDELFLLRDAFFAALNYFESINEFDLFIVAVDQLNWILEKTRDYQKKTINCYGRMEVLPFKRFFRSKQEISRSQIVCTTIG